MEISSLQIMKDKPQSHWWYKNRTELFQVLLRKFFQKEQNSNQNFRKNYTILEVGCGWGDNLPMLEEFGSIEGAESYKEAAQFLKKQYPKYKTFHHHIPDNLNQSYDMICILDVLEHVEEAEAVEWLARHLKPNGVVFVSVPAFSFLWSCQDILCHHKRRYTHSSLKKALAPYFKKERLSYYNFILFPAVLAFNAIDRFFDWIFNRDPLKKENRSFKAFDGILNQILYQIMHVEVLLMKYTNLPIGASLVGFFRKKN